MSENITLTSLVNLQNETTAVNAINSNNAAITTAFTDVLSRSGESPNQMGSTLDMNSNRIINLPSPISTSEPVSLSYMNTYLTTGEGVTGLTGVPVSAAMQPVVDATTTASAVTLLGIPPISTVMQPVVDASTITIAQSLLGIVPPGPGTGANFNVKSSPYNAVGDGVADDTAAIQAAITAAESAGGIVFIPSGSYKVTASLNVTNCVNIQGVGYQSENTITPASSGYTASVIIAYGAITVFNIASDNPVIIEKLQITFANPGAGCVGVLVDTSSTGNIAHFNFDSIIRDIYMYAPNVAVHFRNAGRWLCDHITADMSGANATGIICELLNNPGIGDCSLTNCCISGSYVGILVNDAGGIRIENNKINALSTVLAAGVMIQPTLVNSYGTSPLHIVGNSIEQTSNGILFQRVSGSTMKCGSFVITGNEIHGSLFGAGACISSQQSGGDTTQWVSGGIISGNYMFSFGSLGVHLSMSAAQKINIAANTLDTNGTAASYISSNVANVNFDASNLKCPGVS